MAVNQSNLAQTAARLLSENGRDVTLRSKTVGTFNPATGTLSGGSVSDTTVKAVFVQANKLEQQVLQRGDRVLLTAASVDLEDEVIDGDTYQVVDVSEVKPADDLMFNRVILRR